MTTVKSSNVYNIALKGNFDDCQYIVKKLFNDNDTKTKKFASINSINWTRIMAQISYYVYAFQKLTLEKYEKFLFQFPQEILVMLMRVIWLKANLIFQLRKL